MRVDKIISFDEYWNNPQYKCKRPVVNGSLIQMYGDNFYHTDNRGNVIQEVSAHSRDATTENVIHKKRDVRGSNVLLSNHFYYFGDAAPFIPRNLMNICCTSRNYSYKDISEDEIQFFLDWLSEKYEMGVHGDPISWNKFNLEPLNCYEDK
jgi:hypothetical protein